MTKEAPPAERPVEVPAAEGPGETAEDGRLESLEVRRDQARSRANSSARDEAA